MSCHEKEPRFTLYLEIMNHALNWTGGTGRSQTETDREGGTDRQKQRNIDIDAYLTAGTLICSPRILKTD